MTGRRKQTQFENEPVADDLVEGPVRRCVTTRERHNRDDLIRFVVDPSGVVVPDLACKLPGRGVWVSANRTALDTAIKQRRFAAGFKRAVTVPDTLTEQCAALMRGRTIDALALANKAGLVLAGFEKVSAALGSGEAIALISAADAATDGADKLRRKHRAVMGAATEGAPEMDAEPYDADGNTAVPTETASAPDTGPGLETAGNGGLSSAEPAQMDRLADRASAPSDASEINVLSVEELSLAIGRANVVHAALKSGGAAERFIREAGRLALFGPGMDVDTAA